MNIVTLEKIHQFGRQKPAQQNQKDKSRLAGIWETRGRLGS